MTPGNPLTFTSTDEELDLGRRGVSGREESQTPSHLWPHLQVPEERPTPNIPAPAPLPSVSPSSTSCPVGLPASSLTSSARATSLSHPTPLLGPCRSCAWRSLRNEELLSEAAAAAAGSGVCVLGGGWGGLGGGKLIASKWEGCVGESAVLMRNTTPR